MHARKRLFVACAIGVAVVPAVSVIAEVPPMAVRPVRTITAVSAGPPTAVVVEVREPAIVVFTLRGPGTSEPLLNRTRSVVDAYRFTWQGRDTNGIPVGPGTYVLEIECRCGRQRLSQAVELQLVAPGSGDVDDAGPAPPGELTVVAAQENLLSWSPSPSAGGVSYRVFRSSDPGSGYQLIGETTALRFEDLPAEPGIYWYRVRTASTNGEIGAPTWAVSSDDVHLVQRVGPAGGILAPTTGTVVLEIPSGALDTFVEFTVDQISPPAPATNRAIVTRVFEFGPAGTRFAIPAILRLRYELPKGEALPLNYPEDMTFLQVWDRTTQRWVGVEGEEVDPATSTIVAPLTTLELYAGGAVTDPHGTYRSDTDLCGLCHLSHMAPGPNLHPYETEKETCYQCHNGTGATTNVQAEFGEDVLGSSTKTSYHPVPAPLDGIAIGCSDCHTSHRLRTDFTRLLRAWDGVSVGPEGDPDYLYSTASSPIGNAFCYSCHGSTSTYPAPFGDHTDFETSAHNSSGMPDPPAAPAFPEGTGTSSGIKCLTCHEQHASDQPHLTLQGKPQETLCFDCHTAGTPNTSGGTSPPWTQGPFPGSDVVAAFTGTPNDYSTADGNGIRIFHHPIADSEQGGGTRQVECVSCHNSHLADTTDGATTSKAVDPADVFQKWLFGWDFSSGYLSRGSNASGFCGACHVNPTTTSPLDAGTNVPYDVRMVNDGSADADGRAHDTFNLAWYSNGADSAHGNPSYTADDYLGCPPGGSCELACTACHDFHGSSNAYMLREDIVSPDYGPLAVTDAVWAAGQGGQPGTVTLTVGRHGFGVGWWVVVSGMNPSTYDGTHRLTAVTATELTFELDPDPGPYVGGGTVDPRGVSPGRSYSATIVGFGGLDTAADRARLQTFCLTCHLEQDSSHQSNKLCTECHNHSPSSSREF